MVQWQKRPTWEELANVPPAKIKKINRPYSQYWDGFESGWLKGPLDEIHNMANLKQAREGIKRLALAEAQRTGIPPNLALGNIQGFEKPQASRIRGP